MAYVQITPGIKRNAYRVCERIDGKSYRWTVSYDAGEAERICAEVNLNPARAGEIIDRYRAAFLVLKEALKAEHKVFAEFEPQAPNLDRCCFAFNRHPSGPLRKIVECYSGPHGAKQKWAACPECYGMFVAHTIPYRKSTVLAHKPDEIKNGHTGEGGAENVA